MKIKNFIEAEQFLASHIPKTSSTTFPGEIGLKRAKHFLHLLGNPQEKLKIIHVAGTSGKGSTCYLTSLLLTSQGFKVGLHLSPHLTDVTERFQISGQAISQKEFIFYLNKIIPIIEKIDNITYFEILVGLAFYIFADKKVDYAVIETGLGGWYDGTNVVSRSDKLSVLTKIGLDHTSILGKTVGEIAIQKAMIINEKSQAISIYQDPESEKVIRRIVKLKEANIIFVRGSMDSRLRGNDIIESVTRRLSLLGDYQKENAGLALTAVYYLSLRDKFIFDINNIKNVFEKASFPGRFDIRKINGKTIIFDGAHNPQKMDAFINSLVKKFPDKKFNFLVAFKEGKDYQDMLKIIVRLASKIIITSFFTENQDIINQSVDPKKIKLNAKIIPNLKKAWETILKEDDSIVVTGSLYLVGEIFRLIKNKQTTKI